MLSWAGLSWTEFELVRAGICASGPPSGGDDLRGMEADLWEYLGGRRRLPWDDLSVRQDVGGLWLLAADARGARGAGEIGAALSDIWSGDLSYDHREGHTVVVTPADVSLYGVTQIGAGDFWATVRVRVTLTR